MGDSQVIVVLSPKGGTGKTTVSTNLASYLATNAATSGLKFLAANSSPLAPTSKGALFSTNPMEKTAMHENAIDRLPPESTNAPEDPALEPEKPDHTGGNAAAWTDSIRQVQEFLASHL